MGNIFGLLSFMCVGTLYIFKNTKGQNNVKIQLGICSTVGSERKLSGIAISTAPAYV